jgi:hypothetical protein
VYLGDGCISAHPRGVYQLRVACDLKYPQIIDEITSHIIIIRGVDRVGFTPAVGCVVVSAYWKHWPCVFPQHGAGPKHSRPIELEEWQKSIVTSHPEALVRGLIQTDGCRHINEVVRPTAIGNKRYRYTRYMFTNTSEDILTLFTQTLDLLGIHWTRMSEKNIAVSRRADVAMLDTFVGAKR